jgi:expansin (peptidoglycan-binding protein)
MKRPYTPFRRNGAVAGAVVSVVLLVALTGCSGDSKGSGSGGGTALGGAGGAFGDTYSGQFHLGPVDWEESVWNNACSPYPDSIIAMSGNLLAGLPTGHIDGGRLCDSCVSISAANGNSVVARVVTYGDTSPNDIDVSPAVCTALTGDAGCDVYPRDMSWQFVQCPDTGNIEYQFQTEANEWWTSLWVRNSRLPLTLVEVKSANHADWTALSWGTDGTLTDDSGFGVGEFSLRLTAEGGAQLIDTFPGFQPGDLLESSGQFD